MSPFAHFCWCRDNTKNRNEYTTPCLSQECSWIYATEAHVEADVRYLENWPNKASWVSHTSRRGFIPLLEVNISASTRGPDLQYKSLLHSILAPCVSSALFGGAGGTWSPGRVNSASFQAALTTMSSGDYGASCSTARRASASIGLM